MEVTILANDVAQISNDYRNIFTEQPGFAPPVFSGIQYPTPESNWLPYLTQYMNRPQAIELYNHYLIWLKCLQTLQPQVIVYNRSSPNQPDSVLAQLILAPASVTGIDIDLALYGKYSDRCDLYQRVVDVYVNVQVGNQMTFGLYRTFSPYGGYAYMVTPSGARKLIDAIINTPAPLQIIIKNLSENRVLYTVTYNPSIITLPVDPLENITDTINIGGQVRFECRDPHQPSSYNYGWYIFAGVIIVIVLGLILGVIAYFLVVNLSYRRPESIVYSGSERVALYGSSDMGSISTSQPIPYGPLIVNKQ